MFKIPFRIQVLFIIFCLVFGIPGILLLILGVNIIHPAPVIFGLLMSACGWIPLYIVIRKRVIKAKMLSQGTLIMTRFVSVNLAYYDLFGWRPYILKSQWLDPQTNLIYHFKSPALNMDPSGIIDEDMQIPVYIDQESPKYRYYMDLTKMPEMTAFDK